MYLSLLVLGMSDERYRKSWLETSEESMSTALDLLLDLLLLVGEVLVNVAVALDADD